MPLPRCYTVCCGWGGGGGALPVLSTEDIAGKQAFLSVMTISV